MMSYESCGKKIYRVSEGESTISKACSNNTATCSAKLPKKYVGDCTPPGYWSCNGNVYADYAGGHKTMCEACDKPICGDCPLDLDIVSTCDKNKCQNSKNKCKIEPVYSGWRPQDIQDWAFTESFKYV